MDGMTEALERLVTDATFRAELQADPDAALANYNLDDEERAILTGHLDEAVGASGRVEQRTSKSGMLAGVLDGLDGTGGRSGLDSTGVYVAEDPAPPPAEGGLRSDGELVQAVSDSPVEEDISFVYTKISFGEPADGQDLLAHEATHVAQSDDPAQPDSTTRD